VATSHGADVRIHAGLVLAESICISAFVVEVIRALGGNELSWAYVFEWPLFGGYAVYMWRSLLRAEHGDESVRSAPALDAGNTEARLSAYNEYLREVHETDEPG
jgi:hypothetical protein